jgi:hypothetical protein
LEKSVVVLVGCPELSHGCHAQSLSPSIQEVNGFKEDWRAYLQNFPASGTTLANWPGDNNTGNIYAVKHNPFPYVAEIQADPNQFAKQVPIEQLFSDLGSEQVPAFSYIVPDQCRDMHGQGNTLASCGGVNDTDDNDVKRGDDETGWLVNGIMGSHGGKAAMLSSSYSTRGTVR